jgi:cell division protein FtsB
LNPNWFLRSSTVSWALALSAIGSVLLLLLSPDGIPQMRKNQRDLLEAKRRLVQLHRRNEELFGEVQRLAKKDPDLMEALARRQGFAKPGETVYTFKENGK